MARVHEELVLIKVSKLVKDHEDVQLIDEDTFAALTQLLEGVVGEVVQTGVVVEIEKPE